MKFNRIFTFGCSFTQYSWPTWADIILYENNGYNLGSSGAGYDSILYRILEADRSFNFTPDDQIIILLTAPLRWDIIVGTDHPEWISNGLVLTSKNAKYENELFSVDGIMFKAFYNILLMNDYLKFRNLNFIFGSITNLFKSPEGFNSNIKLNYKTNKLINYIKENVEIKLLDFESMFFDYEKNCWSVTKEYKDFGVDFHPRPKDHFRWVNEVLLKNIDLEIKVSEEIIKEIEIKIDEVVNIGELSQLQKLFHKFYQHRLVENRGGNGIFMK